MHCVALLRRPTVASAVAVVAGLSSLGACAGRVSSAEDYRHKAAQTSKAMVSALETARLAAEQLLAGRSLGNYGDVVVSQAEQDAQSIQTAFDTRQPPDARSRALRQTVDQPLQDGSSALTDLRIAVRDANEAAIRRALAGLDDPLRMFRRLEELA
jgi:hypothetical protein